MHEKISLLERNVAECFALQCQCFNNAHKHIKRKLFSVGMKPQV